MKRNEKDWVRNEIVTRCLRLVIRNKREKIVNDLLVNLKIIFYFVLIIYVIFL